MSAASRSRERWALALLWGSLGLGLVFGPVTPVLLPWAWAQDLVGERLMLALSTFALLGLLVAITSGRRWAWVVFAAYYALNLSVSLRLAGFLLTVTGPFGIPYALQVAAHAAALLVHFLPTGRARYRGRAASR
jgi:hypothetical protein